LLQPTADLTASFEGKSEPFSTVQHRTVAGTRSFSAMPVKSFSQKEAAAPFIWPFRFTRHLLA